MIEDKNKKRLEVFKVLSNHTRLDIIDLLFDGEKCVCEIIKELQKYEQSHISKSLQKLKSVGLIKDRKAGSNVFYSLNFSCVKNLFECIDKFL